LNLDADLVVLSACETSLGTEMGGEGMVALPQALLLAGSRNVVASLWSVPVGPTTDLMQRLYRSMLEDGQSPSRALRATQLALSKLHSDPYYWGAFVSYGE
jgi:CHAT domain-containing protein